MYWNYTPQIAAKTFCNSLIHFLMDKQSLINGHTKEEIKTSLVKLYVIASNSKSYTNLPKSEKVLISDHFTSLVEVF